jgi:glycosyltransferase involved in cell wall biosynthesis
VCVAARLKNFIAEDRGVHFIDLGATYDIERALDWADMQGPYVLIAAGKAFSILMSRRRERCIKRVLVTHDRCAGDTGLKPDVLEQVCDVIFCVSHSQKEKLVSEGAPAHKMVVIHNGVDFSVFSPHGTEQRSPRRIAFSGALVPDKGLHVLIGSFIDLKAKYPDVELEVFGSSSLWSRQEYLDIEKLAATIPGITFHGKKTQREIAAGLRRSAVCVVPSIWFDPYPLTSLEAQACGTPVVAFRMGGLPEGIVNTETGMVVDEVSQQALTASLDRLLSDPSRLHAMSLRAAEHAAVNFRWELVVEKIAMLCETRNGNAATSEIALIATPAAYGSRPSTEM